MTTLFDQGPEVRKAVLGAQYVESSVKYADDFELRIRGALRNGVTNAEIREVLLQVPNYPGASAGVDSFSVARKVFAEDVAKK